MIARAAEGSVRDALSILDQAIVQQGAGGKAASADDIRDMLGLADRSGVWDLLNAVLGGDAKTALEMFHTQYDAGAEPAVVIRDMLELVHLLTRVKAAGADAAGHGAAGEADASRALDMAGRLQMNTLTRAWSLLMKGLSETREAPDPAAAGEMALIRLAYAADLPTPDEALRMLKEGSASPARASSSSPSSTSAPSPGGGRGRAHAQGGALAKPREETTPIAETAPKAARQTSGPQLNSLADIAALAEKKRDAKLRIELESYVHIISFAEGRIEMRLHERAPSNLAGRLTQRLKEWTGEQWVVTVNANGEGAPTLRDARYAEVMEHPLVQKAFEVFPDAEIKVIRDIAPALVDGDVNGHDVRSLGDEELE